MDEIKQKARELLAAEFARAGMPFNAADCKRGEVSPTYAPALRALEQALTQQRGPAEPVATLQVCPPNSDGTAAYFIDRVRDTDAFSKLAPGHYELYTTPQPSADAVLVPRELVGDARDWVRAYADAFDCPDEDPTMDVCRVARELESLLGRGGK